MQIFFKKEPPPPPPSPDPAPFWAEIEFAELIAYAQQGGEIYFPVLLRGREIRDCWQRSAVQYQVRWVGEDRPSNDYVYPEALVTVPRSVTVTG
jgi:hypothetical protein